DCGPGSGRIGHLCRGFRLTDDVVGKPLKEAFVAPTFAAKLRRSSLWAVMLVTLGGSVAYGQTGPSTADRAERDAAVDGDPMVQLNFPQQLELSVLIEYVSKSLDLNILYDEQVANKQVTL